MRENRLTPMAESFHDPSGKLPAERAKAQLERHTRYWPMIISQTTIFNMQAVSRSSTKTFGSLLLGDLPPELICVCVSFCFCPLGGSLGKPNSEGNSV